MSRREAADTAIRYAFDLIEHHGEDMRNRPFLDRKNALARLLRNTEASILFNEHIAQDGAVVFAHACRLGAEGSVSKKVDGTYRSGPSRVWKGPQSCQHRRAAGAERDVEPMSLRRRAPDEDRPVCEPIALRR